ncbi:Borealin N terminal-domain-containing protein [Xylariaceae sp. FL0594]|nr:Borealin N terminal-domain-containing protein [Xylariaceae sp. FL0594]
MAPVRPRKRKSDFSPGTSSPQRSPIKRRKLGITLAQKQALIDNLQLEITERARRLRAQYNIQAQQLRSRVEMRVNRIPMSLRKLKMSELPVKSLQSRPNGAPPRFQYVPKPPPVPAKDGTSPTPITPRKPVPTASSTIGRKRLRCGLNEFPCPYQLTQSSTQISRADKENHNEDIGSPKKRLQGAHPEVKPPVAPSQVLSPTSSNTRVVPRDRPASPLKSMVSRPVSPVKGLTTSKPPSNILSSIVEKAKGTRPVPLVRKATLSSSASSSTGATTATAAAAGRTRKPAAPPPSTAVTRGKRKVSVNSESSDGSTGTVVKKTTTASRATRAAPATKKTVTSTIKSAVTKKAPAAKAAAAAQTTGRTLRKRG